MAKLEKWSTALYDPNANTLTFEVPKSKVHPTFIKYLMQANHIPPSAKILYAPEPESKPETKAGMTYMEMVKQIQDAKNLKSCIVMCRWQDSHGQVRTNFYDLMTTSIGLRFLKDQNNPDPSVYDTPCLQEINGRWFIRKMEHNELKSKLSPCTTCITTDVICPCDKLETWQKKKV